MIFRLLSLRPETLLSSWSRRLLFLPHDQGICPFANASMNRLEARPVLNSDTTSNESGKAMRDDGIQAGFRNQPDTVKVNVTASLVLKVRHGGVIFPPPSRVWREKQNFRSFIRANAP